MTATAPAVLVETTFADVRGWDEDDHAAAFRAFRLSAEAVVRRAPRARPLGGGGEALVPAARAALAAGLPDRSAARRFFEHWFRPFTIRPAAGAGFLTGYYEPVLEGSRVFSAAFPVPLHGRPDDLVEIGPDDDRGGLDPTLTWARRLPDGRLAEHPDRGAVMAGALDGRAPVLAFVRDPVDAFLVHVQGSVRVALAEGGALRLTFAGKSGHAYFPVARVLVERGLMSAAEATADVLRDWLARNPDEVASVLSRNRSYIFFREAPVADPSLGPEAAAGVPLTPGRSLAVDRTLHTFHLPVFVDAEHTPDGPVRRLAIAQDTGSAIVGPARGDLFCGSGEEAFAQAARLRHAAAFTLLRPSDPAP